LGKDWHSINDLYLVKSPQKGAAKTQDVDDEPKKKAEDPEVRLSDGIFLEGDDGFQFNKKCKVKVKVDYLKKTNRKKVTFKLFVVYNGETEDLAHQAEGYEEDGFAQAEMTLFYGDKYSKALQKDPAAKCSYTFKASHSKGEKEIESELLDMPAEDKKKVNVVEVPDITFHHNSAIPCLDDKNSLIISILTALEYASKNSEEELVICGHTDTSGEFEYNYNLSELRARAVKSVLDNDSVAWSEITGQQNKVEDYQLTLKTLNDIYGWSCDPGKVDNVDGPKTQEALKNFQSSYNSKYKASIRIDGKIGTETWKALLTVIVDLIKAAYKKESGRDALPKLHYRKNDNGIYPCGESFPIDSKNKDNYQSQVNRRVELVFYKKEKPPGLKKPEDKKSKISALLCEIYDTAISLISIVKQKEVKPEPVQKEIVITIEYPDKTPHKQYVNLKVNDKDQGHELRVRVEAENAKDKQFIYWKVTAGANNSKRNKPETGLKNPADNKLVKIDKGVAQLETEVKAEKSEVILCCGLAGGDTFTVEVGIKKDEWKQKVEIENWRKLWYQRTFHEKATVPSMATSKKQLKDVYIEFYIDKDKKHNLGSAGSVIVGNHNAADYHKLLDTTHEDQCVNEIFCDKQYDGFDSKGKEFSVKSNTSLTTKKDLVLMSKDHLQIFNPPLQKGAKFLINAIWNNPNLKKNGKLTDDKSKIDDDTGLIIYVDENWVTVELPKNAEPSNKNPVELAITATAASGPWGGDGGTPPHNLIVIDKNDTIHSQCVMHELGHLMNMVPYSGYYNCPPGFKYNDHQYAYIEMGGAGSHCHFKHDKSKSTSALYVDGRCIMFHQLNYNCQLSYCPDCTKFIKAQTLHKFKDL